MTTFKCSVCESTASDDYAQWSSILKSNVCESCWANDFDGMSTVRIVDTNGEVETIHVGDLNTTTEYGDESDLPVKRGWINTDGWRGYYNTTIEGWSSVLTGWTTGGWDDAVAIRKRLFNQFVDEIMTGNIYPPCQVAVITDPTSNLFSTGITVQVETKNEATFIEWLDSSEYSQSELTQSLS